MGRRARGILEYAKTITWYDYLFNEAKKLKELKIINEYQFYKFMYSNSIYSPEAKLFKKYKFGLSTPQKSWKESTEKNIPGATCIIQHPIWDIENTKFTSNKIINDMHNLSSDIRGYVISDGLGCPQPICYPTLEKIISFENLDAIYSIYLLYQWGLIINNYELCNYCAIALEKNLKTLLLNISYLHRSHIFLFDIIFDKIRKISYRGLTIADVTNINWRLLRAKKWNIDIRMNSYVSEYKLSRNSIISKKFENKEIYISDSDALIFRAKIATDPNDLITLHFNDFFPSHIILYYHKVDTHN